MSKTPTETTKKKTQKRKLESKGHQSTIKKQLVEGRH